ncbi:hypothetical protein QT972_04390 [Microcoleus sp. herbarium7]
MFDYKILIYFVARSENCGRLNCGLSLRREGRPPADDISIVDR